MHILALYELVPRARHSAIPRGTLEVVERAPHSPKEAKSTLSCPSCSSSKRSKIAERLPAKEGPSVQNAPARARGTGVPVAAIPTAAVDLLKQRGTRPEVHAESCDTMEPCPILGHGWTQQVVPRKKRSPGAPRAGRDFFGPEGETFRSMAAAHQHLRRNDSTCGSAGTLRVEDAPPKSASIDVLVRRRRL